ncbi:MAG: hypothetical protein NZ822_01270 [Patescibacteria group bacterium]|nr:hypothetical protein [Patescibacteria group bacterium]
MTFDVCDVYCPDISEFEFKPTFNSGLIEYVEFRHQSLPIRFFDKRDAVLEEVAIISTVKQLGGEPLDWDQVSSCFVPLSYGLGEIFNRALTSHIQVGFREGTLQIEIFSSDAVGADRKGRLLSIIKVKPPLTLEGSPLWVTMIGRFIVSVTDAEHTLRIQDVASVTKETPRIKIVRKRITILADDVEIYE